MGIDSPKVLVPEIQGLRAIAVMLVVIFHLSPKLLTGGYIGVDIFFVISGYLITGIIARENNSFNFKNFYVKRFWRLFPALVTVIFITQIVAMLVFSPALLERMGYESIAAMVSVANLFYWQEQGYFNSESIVKPFLHYWSLSVEEQFYLFWPVIIVMMAGLSVSKKLLGLMLIATLGFLGALVYRSVDNSAVFFLTPFRIFEFAIGALVVWAPNFVSSRWQKSLLINLSACVSVLVLIGAAYIFDKKTPHPSFSILVPCFAVAWLLYITKWNITVRCLSFRFLTHIGNMSYSIYLVHWPIIVFTSFILFEPLSPWSILLAIISTYFLAWLLHQYIEKPLRYQHGHRMSFVSMVILAVLVTSLGIYFSISEGAQWRISSKYLYDEQYVATGKRLDYGDCDKAKKWEAICEIGAPQEQSKVKILLIGDSHAGHLRYGLDRYGKENAVFIRVWKHTGCKPVFGTYTQLGRDGATRERKSQSCLATIKAWEKEIDEENYDAVILSAKWSATHYRKKHGKDRKPPTPLVSLVEADYNITPKDLFAQKLSSTVSKILQNGKKVIVFSQVPRLYKNYTGCNETPLLQMFPSLLEERCKLGISKKSMLSRVEHANSTISSFENDRVLSILPSNYFCGAKGKSCMLTKNGKLLYKDDNHISPYGSVSLINSVESQLSNFLQ